MHAWAGVSAEALRKKTSCGPASKQLEGWVSVGEVVVAGEERCELDSSHGLAWGECCR